VGTNPGHVSPRRIVLRNERKGNDIRHLEAYLDAEGALHIDGQDLGPGTAPVSDDGEYEWFRTVPASELPRLVELLGGQPGEPILDLLARRYTGRESYELERVISEGGIRSDLSVWR